MNKNHIALSIQFFIITFIYVHAMLHSTPTPNANNESDSYAVSIWLATYSTNRKK